MKYFRLLTARDRRALAAGAISIGALLSFARGVPAWRSWNGRLRSRTAAATADVARAEALLRTKRPLHDSLAAWRRQLDTLDAGLVPGDSPAAAGAALVGIVASAASRAGVVLGALQIVSDSARWTPFEAIEVHTAGTGDIEGVSTFLSALEGGPRRLAVRSLSISQSDPGATADHGESLRVELTVEALVRLQAVR